MWGLGIVIGFGGAFFLFDFCLFVSDLFINLCSFLFVLGTPKSAGKEDRKEEGE